MEKCGGNSHQCGGEGGEEEEEEKASEEKDEKKQICVNLPDNQEDGPEHCDNGDDDGGGSSSEEEDDCFTRRDACVQVGDGRVPPLKGEGCSHTVSFFFGTEPKWMSKGFFIIFGYHLHHHFVVIS